LFFSVIGFLIFLALFISYISKRTERQLVTEARSADFLIQYDYEWDAKTMQAVEHACPRGPALLRRIFGDDVLAHPTRAFFGPGPGKPDKALPNVGRLTTLTSVHMSNLSANSEPFKALCNLPNLNRLVLVGPIDFHDLGSIPPMPSVATLQLENRCYSLSDSVCALIAEKFPRISELVIEGGNIQTNGPTQLSDQGLSEFRGLPQLIRLSVRNFPIALRGGTGDFSGSPSLKELCVEIQLDFSSTAPALQQVKIHDCPALERIMIAPFDPIHWDGAHWLGISLEQVPKIKELHVEKSRQLELDNCVGLQKLMLGNDCDISAADFSKIIARAHLVEVGFSFCDGNLAQVLEDLQHVSSLRRLVVRSSGLTWNGDPAGIDFRGIGKRVGRLKQIEILEVESTGPNRFDDHCLRELEQLQNLQSLTLYGARVSHNGIKRIESAIPGLSCNTTSLRVPAGTGAGAN
jgi:hypothetical protein